MVFYRKYRPQTIEELDSAHVREVLTASLSGLTQKNKNVFHAFLFTGPKGLGKTSTARIVAKVVNCTKKKTSIEPCNECDQCISITNGTNVDVLEIDAASNRGIDEMRDLREKIKLLPVSATYKVYIIDEVHMLTTEAFNALLKTLEEPPPHALFILCTTEPQKIPATVLSRCFHIPFKKATSEELLRSFQRIVDTEKIAIDKEALLLLASLSDGSFRDGTKLLEEMAIQAKGKITKDTINTLYQVVDIKSYVTDFLFAMDQKNAKEILVILEEASEKGIEMKLFTEKLLETLHTMLLVTTGVVEKSELAEKIQGITIPQIKKMADAFSKAYLDIKYAVIPQLPLELAALTCIAYASETKPQKKEENVTASVKASTQVLPPPTQVVGPEGSFWREFIEKVKEENHTIAGVLRGCHILPVEHGKLIIETAYTFHKERLESKTTMELLEKVGQALTGNKVTVSIVLKS